ncbi:MAG: glycoside hydrolase family 127 protein, partial [Planctomycetes bacterium]|nr:glycoside hydrolase family 127 protein [Planctomycetota bacterium]
MTAASAFSALRAIRLHDRVLAPRQASHLAATLPSSLKRCEETGRLDAFRLQWREGMPNHPHVFWDSDVAKVVEGMAAAVEAGAGGEVAAELERLVDLIVSAQQPDGYLNTFFTQCEPERRWADIFNAHELYCAGHLMEAAVAHFRATGSRKFLDAMQRYSDRIAADFLSGPRERACPGHEEIELALVALYRATGEKRHLDLAKHFIDVRGGEPNYFVEKEHRWAGEMANRQAQAPVREQRQAVGHAVRAVYLYCGMVDVAVETGDAGLLEAAKALFADVAGRQMYVTGGIGATHEGEAFLGDWDLPNCHNYAESCAAIGLLFFAHRLLAATGDGQYADVVERVLYNNGLSGISLSGDAFFYANPMAMDDRFKDDGHIARERRPWFDCSCCPTTYCRFLPRLGTYCYDARPDAVRVDIPAAGAIAAPGYEMAIESDYPYDGRATLRLTRGEAAVKVRVPGWCQGARVTVNGKAAPEPRLGYVDCGRLAAGAVVELDYPMRPGLVYANPRVLEDLGKAAVGCGPLVYCAESADNPGVAVERAFIKQGAEFARAAAQGLPEGTAAWRVAGAV